MIRKRPGFWIAALFHPVRKSTSIFHDPASAPLVAITLAGLQKIQQCFVLDHFVRNYSCNNKPLQNLNLCYHRHVTQ